jgi:hypothetical protein
VPQAFHGVLEHEQSTARIDNRGLFGSAKTRVIQRNHLVQFDELLHRVHLPALAFRRLDYARLMPYLGAFGAMNYFEKGGFQRHFASAGAQHVADGAEVRLRRYGQACFTGFKSLSWHAY